MSSKKQQRRAAISALVLEQGAVTVGSLAEQFGVSMQTIRRDVDTLCKGDTLHRVHGRTRRAATMRAHVRRCTTLASS